MITTNAETGKIGWQDGLVAFGLIVFSLALYLRTLVPGLIPNDGSEFQVLAYTLGHAHTTGYHVYILLAKLFTLLAPVNDIAFRVNMFSAVCAAMTIGLVFLAGKLLSGSRWGALIGSLALAIAATFWSQAIIAEVYTAGSLFTASVLLCVMLWYRGGNTRWLFAAGLLGGLGISVHSSNLLFAPAVLLLLLLRRAELRKTWKPALAGALLGLALLVASFLLIDAQPTNSSIMRSAYLPSLSRWDMQAEDLDTPLERFTFLVFARQWRSAMFADPAILPRNAWRFLSTLAQDFAIPVLLLTAAGLVGVFRRDRRLGWFFLTAILVHGLYTFNYRIGDIYVFFISIYVVLAMLISEGTSWLLRQLGYLPGRWQLPASFARIAHPLLAVLLIVLAAAPFAAHRLEGIRAGEVRFRVMELPPNGSLAGWHSTISRTVESLPEDAIVLMDWYPLYGYYYAAHVEQGKTGMLFIEAYPYATNNAMADTLFVFLREEMQKGRPVYALSSLNELQRGGFRLTSQSTSGSRLFVVEER